MSWREARLAPFALTLVHPIVTAHGRMTERRGWLLRLFDPHGVEGHAVAMPVAGFGGESFEACGAALAEALDAATGTGGSAAAAGPRAAGPGATPFAASAWALAEADLDARRTERSLPDALADALGDAQRAPRCSVAVNALAGADEPAALRAQVQAAGDAPVVKLKVGADVDAALERIACVVGALAPGQRLRIDPNASWSEADAARALAALADLPVEYVEQPVADAAALARLRRDAPVPVAADESASDPRGLAAIVADRGADVVVLKPLCIGGPRLAARLGAQAQAAGLGVTVTSLLDSALGVRAALAVALALPETPLACGLATRDLFEADLVASPPSASPGRLSSWVEPGLGTAIDETALAALALAPVRGWERSA